MTTKTDFKVSYDDPTKAVITVEGSTKAVLRKGTDGFYHAFLANGECWIDSDLYQLTLRVKNHISKSQPTH